MIYKLLTQYFRARIYGFVLTRLFKQLKNPKYMKAFRVVEYALAILEIYRRPSKSPSTPTSKKFQR